MQKKFWFPKTMPERLKFFQNFRAKIGKYQAALGFTSEQIAEMEMISADFIASYEWVKSCEATMKAAFAWRDTLYNTAPKDLVASEAPAFPLPPAVTSGEGIIERMYRFRRQIVCSDGYTDGIGADLGIIGAAEEPVRMSLLQPTLKISATSGRNVSIRGSMQKMSAILIEYRPENGNWGQAAVLMNLPMTINLPAKDSAIAERGSFRAIYLRKNAQCGNYSPEYPVVLY